MKAKEDIMNFLSKKYAYLSEKEKEEKCEFAIIHASKVERFLNENLKDKKDDE